MTAEDQPYLVMEYVSGVCIDQYCTDHSLTPPQCLDLILQVCAAVQYAHGQLMVHQDLKPGNILVNKRGESKLLDFGIAAAAGGDEDRGIALFTPLYAAPEQILGGKTSTATDIYQLGLLIFKLLTGSAAFSEGSQDLPRLKERILNDPPPRPSAFARLPPSWRADLDAIVGRCLRKDPAQRYPSVAQLENDLRAMGEDRPVVAVAGGLGYRFGKWRRRRRVPIMAAGGLLLLGATVGGLYWQQLSEQREQAELSADRAAAASGLLADILESVDPLAGGGQGQLADVISTSSFEFSAERKYHPDVQREMMLMTSKTLLDLGRYEDVINMVEPLVTQLAEEQSQAPAYAEYLSLLGYAHYRNGDLEQGLSLLEKALARQVQDPGIDPDVFATTLQRAALAERRAARPERARAHIERALKLLDEHLPGSDVRLAQARSHLGLVLTDLGKYQEAIASFEKAVAIYAQAPGDQQLRRAMTLGNLADAQRLAGLLESAEANARAAVNLAEGAADDNPQLLATANVALGNVLISERRYEDAAQRYRQARDIYLKTLGENHPRIALVAHNLGMALRLDGHCPEALKYFDESIRIAAAAYPPDHPELRESRRQRARCTAD